MATPSSLLAIGLALTSVSHLLAEQQDSWSPGHNQSFPTMRFDSEKDVKFYLYTQNNPTSATSLSVGDVSTLANFNPDLSTKVIVHGWLAGPKDMDDSREAYIATGQDLNVVMVDWTAGANNILYNLAKDDVVSVGERIAALLNFLSEQGLEQTKVHITGHSLGAHIAGVAGNRLTAGKVGRITGLDPAAPLYGQESLENRLDPTDASFVEVVHTCAGLLGWADPMGHVDFYPNSGEPVQPGCGTDLAELGLGSCSHIRARALFAESITTSLGFVGVLCSDWKTYENDGCSQNPTALMGDPTDISAKEGSYYLTTASSSPFAQG